MKMRLSRVSVLFLVVVIALASLGAAYAAWTDSITLHGTVDTGELDFTLAGWASMDGPDCPGEPPDYYAGLPDWHCNPGFVFEPGVGIFWPDPDGKNVGCTVLTPDDPDGDGDFDALGVELNNVYPSYFNSITLYPQNTGTIPLKIWKVRFLVDGQEVVEPLYETGYWKADLSGNDVDDIEFKWQDNFGFQLEPGEQSYEISFWIHILQDEGEGVQGQTFDFTIQFIAIQWNEYQAGPVEGACEKFAGPD